MTLAQVRVTDVDADSMDVKGMRDVSLGNMASLLIMEWCGGTSRPPPPRHRSPDARVRDLPALPLLMRVEEDAGSDWLRRPMVAVVVVIMIVMVVVECRCPVPDLAGVPQALSQEGNFSMTRYPLPVSHIFVIVVVLCSLRL